MSQDTCLIAEGISSIGPQRAKKTPKLCKVTQQFRTTAQMTHFECFLSPPWSNWPKSFCDKTSILRHKFRLPTHIIPIMLKGLFLGLAYFRGGWAGEILMEIWFLLQISLLWYQRERGKPTFFNLVKYRDITGSPWLLPMPYK